MQEKTEVAGSGRRIARRNAFGGGDAAEFLDAFVEEPRLHRITEGGTGDAPPYTGESLLQLGDALVLGQTEHRMQGLGRTVQAAVDQVRRGAVHPGQGFGAVGALLGRTVRIQLDGSLGGGQRGAAWPRWI